MPEKYEVPEEVFEALIRLNIGSYAYRTMKEMHGLLVTFARGMEAAYAIDHLPPAELVNGSFEGLLAGANHIKEMLKLFGEPDNEVMVEHKKNIGVEHWDIANYPELEAQIHADPRIQRLGILVNETVDDVKLRLGGEQLAREFSKILKDVMEKDSNDPQTD